MRTRRGERGAVLGIVAAFVFTLCMLTVAFSQICMYMGGASEMRNAVDAGALNVGKKVLSDDKLKVNIASFGNEAQFLDVTDKDGKIGLGNVNRIWGKVLLAEANASAMQSEGTAGNSKANADKMFDTAKVISSELADKLNDDNKLYGLFDQLSGQNSLRMLGVETRAKAAKQAASWETSLLDREKESNLEVTTSEIMPGSTYGSLPLVDGYLAGYKPFTVGGKSFCFVPFRDKERTHLVSGVDFDANTASAKALTADWGTPVPNSFSCSGASVDHKTYGQEGMAYVMSNPQNTFKLSIPHSFIHIKLETNDVNWTFYGTPPLMLESHYDYLPDLKSKTGPGILSVLQASNIPVGTEFVPPNLEQAIFGNPFMSDKQKIEKTLVQRINQMISKPGEKFDASQLHALLSRPDTMAWIAADKRDYYIFSPDGEHIEVQPKLLAAGMAAWLALMIDHEADGSEKTLCDSTFLGPPIIPYVMLNMTPDPFCVPAGPPFGFSFINGEIFWKPGSGYDGCLGEMRVKRETDIHLSGVCTPII